MVRERIRRSAQERERRETPLALLGGRGLVLSRFTELSPESVISSPGSDIIDITNYGEVARWIENLPKGSCVVLGAAYTDVDGAERERDKALRINTFAPEAVARLCKEYDHFLLHLSTEFVFTGSPNDRGPYPETKEPQLNHLTFPYLGWYAQTKLLGEQAVLESGAKAAVIRISYPSRAFYLRKTDFVHNILDLYDRGKLYTMFDDQFITPCFIDELCHLLEAVAKRRMEGIFHCGSSNTTTPHEFASGLLEQARGVEGVVQRSSIADFRKRFPEKAPRPQHGGLDSEKTQKQFGIRFMTWEEQIGELVKQMGSISKDLGGAS